MGLKQICTGLREFMSLEVRLLHSVDVVFCIYSLLRHLLKGRCRLGAFSRSLLAWHFAPSSGEVTGSSEIFPLPLPYPEVFQKKHRAEDARGALKKGVVAVVIVLNFLFMQRSKSVGDAFRGQKRLTKSQWEAVGRIEKFLRA